MNHPLLDQLDDLAIQARRDGDALVLEGDTALVGSGLLTEIKSAKPELLRILDCEASLFAQWRSKSEGTPPDFLWSRLRDVSLKFIASPWAGRAVRLGWRERELFGVFSGQMSAVTIRVDAQGLVSTIALAPFAIRLVALGPAHAILETQSGSRLATPREPTGPSITWWHHRTFDCVPQTERTVQ